MQQTSILGVGLFSTLASTPVEAGINFVETTGFHTSGKGGARYVRTNETLPAWGEGLWWAAQEGVANAGWKWKLAEAVPTSDMFGTVGDAARGHLEDPVTGTDVTAILNAFTFYLETYGFKLGILSKGNHRVSDTIHVGRGTAFVSLLLQGECPSPTGAWDPYPAARIITDKNDRPCVSVQGIRNGGVSDIVFYGPLTKYVMENRLGASDNGGPMINDVDPAVWLPASGSHSDARFKPGCAMAVDPYSAARPGSAWVSGRPYGAGSIVSNAGNYYQARASEWAGTTAPTGEGSGISDGVILWDFIGDVGDLPDPSYPDAPYGSYESATQWGRNYSSAPCFTRCQAWGFSVGVACQPSDSDGNADFLDCRDSTFLYCIRAISIGNSQSRAVNTENMRWHYVHTVLSGSTHGRQIGFIAGNHSNWSGGHQIALLDYSAGFSGPVEIANGYLEGGYRIANLQGNGGTLTFRNCNFGLFQGDSAYVKRGHALNHIGLSPTNPSLGLSAVRIVDCSIGSDSLFIINSQDVEVSGSVLTMLDRNPAPTDPYIAAANNALAGGWAVPLMMAANGGVARIGCRYRQFNTTTGQYVGMVSFDGEVANGPKRTTGTPIYAERFRNAQGVRAVDCRIAPVMIDHVNITTRSLVGRRLTLVQAATFPSKRQEWNLDVGDIIWHDTTGLWFFISSFDPATGTIVAKLQNGYCDDSVPVTYPVIGTPNLNQGNFWCYSGRHYLPDYTLFGEFDAGTNTCVNVADKRGNNFAMSSIGVGDYFLIDVDADDPYVQTQSDITSVIGSTITFNVSFPSLYDMKDKRLAFRRSGIAANATP